MTGRVRTGGVKDHAGDFGHWWASLAAIPASKDTLAYRRLRTIWGDQTRARGKDSERYLEFYRLRTETSLTAALWENFTIFPAEQWLPALVNEGGFSEQFGDVVECQWSYGWSAGKPNKIADVVIHARTREGTDRIIVVEAKRPGGRWDEKDLSLAYYLDSQALREAAPDRWILFCVDEREESRLREALSSGPDKRWLLTTWQRVAALQVALAKRLDAPEPIRAFVASAIQYQFCQHDIRPALLAAEYLEREPSAADCDSTNGGKGSYDYPPTDPLWRLPPSNSRNARWSQPIPNDDLRLEDVPLPEDSIYEIFSFALTYNGYREAGSSERCAEIAHAQRNETLDDLRTCLFFEQRAARHVGVDPEGEHLDYVRGVVRQVREKLSKTS